MPRHTPLLHVILEKLDTLQSEGISAMSTIQFRYKVHSLAAELRKDRTNIFSKEKQGMENIFRACLQSKLRHSEATFLPLLSFIKLRRDSTRGPNISKQLKVIVIS